MGHRVLLIEDDPDMRAFTGAVFEGAGFTVAFSGGAQEALRDFRECRPDLVILDIGLPDGSGMEVCRAIKAGPGAETPLLFLTSRNDVKTRLECFRLGAQDYMLKPFNAEELLARAQVHLKIKVTHDRLAKAKDSLELINRARQDLSDMIVHDLKNPLACIMGTLSIIQAKGLISNGEYHNLIKSAGSASEFMLLMINDLLDVGRAETSGLPVKTTAVDLADLLQKLRALFSPRLERREARLECRLAADAAVVSTDQSLLFRILANLISNALSYTQKGGVIELESSRQGPQIRLVVLDRGPGVPESQKKTIFEKYATSEVEPRSDGRGTGIGLAFCRLAAQALHGRIWVEDRVGGGSRFTLEFPSDPPGL